MADQPTDLQEIDPSPAQHRRQALGFGLGGVSGLLIGTIAGVLIYSQFTTWDAFSRFLAAVFLGGVTFFAGAVSGAIIGKATAKER
ncbi:MAG TPA: hypothetical protein ENH80_00870 [Phycisphaerae bacterium]|nr:hypothetical protein [Phycisphaerae bacterium]HDZ42470.1 hypothetical protein [Phycisphaerae bacterium]